MDFPREGNGSSFMHARRQFNLIDDPLLRYRYLYEFDKVMNNTESKYKWLSAPQVCRLLSRRHCANGVRRRTSRSRTRPTRCLSLSGLGFCSSSTVRQPLYTFHSRLTRGSTVSPTESFVDYRVGVETPGKYKIVLNSDEKRFGGHDRVDMSGEYFTTDFPWNDRKNFLQVGSITQVQI